jgi:hypothetical protein
MSEVHTILANEARKTEIRQKIARFRGVLETTSSVINKLSSVNDDTTISLNRAIDELAALEMGSGPGVTDTYGPKSKLTLLLDRERLAAKEAVYELVQKNPKCTEAEAVMAWDRAAISTHKDLFEYPLQSGSVFLRVYRTLLVKMAQIREDSWEAQRQWLAKTPRAKIFK